EEYGQKLKDGKYDVALFFYAGHGLQVKGNNYLVPVDGTVNQEQDVEYECVDAGRVLAKMEGAGSRINIIIMDACRDNPFERSWSRSSKGNGLATMDAPVGSIVCYSTSPGKTASDGGGNNGLYTEELLKHLNTPGLALEEVFKRVRIGVISKSNREQTPWETSSLTGDFFFVK
ncbi:MAG: caspase family protein, partial [Cytophagales bacterium]